MPKGANPRRRKARRGQPTKPRSITENAPVLADLIEGEDIDEALSINDLRDAVSTAVRQSWGHENEGRYVWTRDVVIEDDGSMHAIVDVEGDGTPGPGNWKVPVTTDEALNVTLGEPVEVQAVTTYEPVEADTVAESLVEADVVPLAESTIRTDGTIPVCFISPGWGSSGYYSAEVLEAAADEGVFAAGTHMYWDHPTETDRPERSLRDLAGVTVTDAAWLESGPSGPGLYADAKPFPGFVEAIEEMAPYIGVSIRAGGQLSTGTVEGRTGPIVESIDEGRSIDFVTVAGRGGHVISEGRTVASAFASLQSSPTPPPPLKETPPMSTPTDLTEAQAALTEAQAIGQYLVAFIEAHRAESAEDRREIERLREALADRDARDLITEALNAEDAPELRETARKRVIDAVLADLPLDEAGKLDGDALKAKVTEAATAEVAYLAEATGSPVVGMGAPGADTSATDDVSGFFERRYGFSEATSKDIASR